MHKRGLAIYLTKDLVELYIRRVRLKLASWATSSKASGRGITNCSAGGKPPLNLPEVKAATDKRYGEIEHPTIGDFVWELNSGILDDVTGMYVDDILGVCLRKDLDCELAKAKKLLTDLLGEKAVAEHKNEAGFRLTVIGYFIDLDKDLVAIAERNALRALHGYMTTDLTEKHPVKSLQKLSSWRSCYRKICRHIRPFGRYLHRALTRVLDLNADVLPSLCQPGWVLDSDMEFVSFVERVKAKIDRF
jgi:hypothetical protein